MAGGGGGDDVWGVVGGGGGVAGDFGLISAWSRPMLSGGGSAKGRLSGGPAGITSFCHARLGAYGSVSVAPELKACHRAFRFVSVESADSFSDSIGPEG